MYRVLIADGEPLTRQALSTMIGRVDDFTAAHAVGDGRQAVSICRDEPVDMVFMSTVLPALSGLEAARRIRERDPNIALVLMSTSHAPEHTSEALHLKLAGHIVKPISFHAINNILMTHKEQHAFLSLEQLEGLLQSIAARDFKRACHAIGPVAEEIRARAGGDPRCREELLLHAVRSLRASQASSLCGQEGEALPPPVSVEQLAVDSGVDLHLFQVVDYIFQRNGISGHPVLEQIFTFIDGQIRKKIGLEDIVRYCPASQTHVSRMFKKHFNASVMDYLHMRKLHLAKMHFAFTERSAGEVAFILGYNEAGYFSKVFKKYERMTLQQYKTKQLGACP